MHPDVARYLQDAPPDHRPRLEELRGLILEHFPEAEEAFDNQFPVYKVGGEWAAGFATRSRCVMFYLMDREVMDAYADRLGKLVTGRSCVQFKASRELSLEDVRGLAAEMLAASAGRRKRAGRSA